MGKTKNLFKRIVDIKGKFHARMGTIKDRNGKDQTEAEEIKKRWKNTLYPHLDNHDGVVTNLDPDILECEVKWIIGNIAKDKTNDGIPTELFQILKVMLFYVNMLEKLAF